MLYSLELCRHGRPRAGPISTTAPLDDEDDCPTAAVLESLVSGANRMDRVGFWTTGAAAAVVVDFSDFLLVLGAAVSEVVAVLDFT